jgi:hypothetical protein|tara:strand:- start:271 stop:552 length:282 start_codon:yes stop_codon:yes gene_type:complete
MKVYVTFSKKHGHHHIVQHKTLTHKCVATFECASYEEGENMLLGLFDGKFHAATFGGKFNLHNVPKYYPEGLVELDASAYRIQPEEYNEGDIV